jgi:two-component system, NarL family, response regulator NreC
MSANILKVFLVEEHRLFRDALRALLLLENSPVRVQGEAASVGDALRSLREVECHVCTLGFSGGAAALDELRLLRENFPELPVLVLASDSSEQVLDLMVEGANGYLSKGAPVSEFLLALETVGRGGAYIHPRMASSLLNRLRRGAPDKEETLDLLPREKAVLDRLVRGLSNAEIARELFLSASTVKSTLRALFAKFQVSDRTRLVANAVSRGLVGVAN